MTLAALLAQARRYARIDSAAASDAQVQSLIQDAVDKFSRDVGGFPMDVNMAIAASFDTETNFAIHIKIVENGSTVTDEDVVIAAAARDDASGTTVASDLQTAIRAMTGATGTETVTWANFYFTVDFKQGATLSTDSIVISSPTTTTYVDATEVLGLSGTHTGSTVFTGSFPQDCTNFVTLPSDAIRVDRIEWDYDELIQTGLEYVQSPEATGDPTHYAIRGRRIYIAPCPDNQDRFEVWYRGTPAAIDFDTDTDVPTEIPEMYQEALIWLTASFLLREAMDTQEANICRAEYQEIMKRYRQDYANLSTEIEDNAYRRWPRLPKILSRQGL